MSDAVAPVVDAIDLVPGWLGPLLGGGVLSIVSAAGSYVIEKKPPTTKTVGRDFILGAIFFLLISQLLPESTGKLLASIFTFFAMKATATSVDDIGGSLLEEMEVRVGVPQF